MAIIKENVKKMHREYPDFLIPGMILTAARASRASMEVQMVVCFVTGLSVVTMIFLEGAHIEVDKKRLMAFLVIFSAVVLLQFDFYNNSVMELI